VTAWDQGPEEVNGSHTANGSAIWSSGRVLATEEKVTLIRLRGLVTITILASASVGDGFFGAFGIGLVSSAAFTAGVAAVPTPITEIAWPGWMWHEFFDVRTSTATIADGVNAVGVVSRIQIDSKAMRKWGSDQTLMGITEVVESGVAQIETQASVRMLVKLS